MGQVIQLRTANVRPEVVERMESMLAKARAGTLRGWVGVADIENGKPIGVACGSFADDPERAVKAAAKGLDVLKGYVGSGEKNTLPLRDYVPARLREA